MKPVGSLIVALSLAACAAAPQQEPDVPYHSFVKRTCGPTESLEACLTRSYEDAASGQIYVIHKKERDVVRSGIVNPKIKCLNIMDAPYRGFLDMYCLRKDGFKRVEFGKTI